MTYKSCEPEIASQSGLVTVIIFQFMFRRSRSRYLCCYDYFFEYDFEYNLLTTDTDEATRRVRRSIPENHDSDLSANNEHVRYVLSLWGALKGDSAVQCGKALIFREKVLLMSFKTMTIRKY